jgi:hypothetical protein
MAFRLAARAGISRAGPLHRTPHRQYVSAAEAARPAAPVILKPNRYDSASNHSLQKSTGVTNPDPAPDSPTGRLVGAQSRFMVTTYSRPTPVFERGEGCHLWDTEKRRYLDFTAGIAVNSLGHCDPQVAQVLHQQVRPPAPGNRKRET